MSFGPSSWTARTPWSVRWGVSLGALFAYAVNDFTPSLVADFVDGVFASGSEEGSLEDIATYTGGLSTMVDSDGLVKWCPHNLWTSSEDLSVLATNGDNSPTATTDPVGGNTAWRLTEDNSAAQVHQSFQAVDVTGGGQRTLALWVRYDGVGDARVMRLGPDNSDGAISNAFINTQTGVVEFSSGTPFIAARSTAAFDGWFYVELDFDGGDGVSVDTFRIGKSLPADPTNPSYDGDGVSGIVVWRPHVYRSDLGGMVNNPATGDSYVPTEGAAVYLPRQGHHRYEGGQWVNKGLLFESEAATNILTESNQEPVGSATFSLVNATAQSESSGFLTGTNEGVRLTASAGFGNHFVTMTGGIFTLPAEAVDFTCSVYIKDISAGFAFIQFLAGNPGIDTRYVVNLADGTFSHIDGAVRDLHVEQIGDGEFRIGITATSNGQAANSPSFIIGPHDGGIGQGWTANGDEELIIKNLQVERGSFPTSYIPTSGSIATRDAQSLQIDNPPFPTEAPLALSIAMAGEVSYADNNDPNEVMPFRWLSDASNFIDTRVLTDAGSGQYMVRQSEGGIIDQVATSDSSYYSPGIDIPFGVASRHGETLLNGAVDGVALTEDNTPTALPNLASSSFEIGPNFSGTISQLRIWTEDIGDAGLVEASTL